MADYLVEQLRSYPQHCISAHRAADRIEQLEALIALIEDLDPNVMDEARAALEGKDG